MGRHKSRATFTPRRSLSLDAFLFPTRCLKHCNNDISASHHTMYLWSIGVTHASTDVSCFGAADAASGRLLPDRSNPQLGVLITLVALGAFQQCSMLRSSVAHLPLSSLASSSRRPLHRTIYAQVPNVLGILYPRQRPRLAPTPIHFPTAPALSSRRHAQANRTWIYGTHIRTFHATPRREGLPLIGVMLLSVFKVCTCTYD